jgi:hypothetical protein
MQLIVTLDLPRLALNGCSLMHLLHLRGLQLLLLLGALDEQNGHTLLRIHLLDSPFVAPEAEGGILAALEAAAGAINDPHFKVP